MKCMLLKDHHADTKTVSDVDRPKLKFWWVDKKHPTKGKMRVPVAYFPAGTIFEHDVIGFITRGMAAPADEEAVKACGFTEEELKGLQHAYNRCLAGIDEADAELFDLGVITGYDLDGNYKHGPNWDSYMEGRGETLVSKKVEKTDDGI